MKSGLIFCLIIAGLQSIGYCKGEEKSWRKLDAQLNPGCPDNICNDTNQEGIVTIVHVLADGSTDRLHYVWDFTGKPSILMALTPLNTTMKINWAKFMNNDMNSVEFSAKPFYTSSIVINKLWQFNDTEDTGGSFPLSGDIIAYATHNIRWQREHFLKSDQEVTVSVNGDNRNYFGPDGKVKLNLKCFGVEDHGNEFPHLIHSSNSTEIDLVFDNLKINSTFPGARFGLEMLLVSGEHSSVDRSFSMHTKKSLDDEHTPGIFEIIEIASPASFLNAKGSYIQYRPVSYTHPERDVSTSTELHITMPSNLDNPVKQLNSSLAWAYYGYLLDEFLVQGFNVSFGMSEDGFYKKTNYTTWTFVMGYGVPPNEQLSMFVIIVASIGLGMPLLLLVCGGVYICIRRVRNRG